MNNTEKETIDILLKIITQKNNLLVAYRLGNNNIAIKAIDALGVLYQQLGYEPK